MDPTRTRLETFFAGMPTPGGVPGAGEGAGGLLPQTVRHPLHLVPVIVAGQPAVRVRGGHEHQLVGAAAC